MKLKGIVIDNGGSQLRTVSMNKGNSFDKNLTVVTNDIYSISEASFRVKEVADNKQIIRIEKAQKVEYIGIYGAGKSALMFGGTKLALDPLKKKTDNQNFYKQLLFGVFHKLITDLVRDYGEDIPSSVTDDVIEIALTCTIPVKEWAGSSDRPAYLKECINGMYTVSYPCIKNNPTFTVSIKSVHIGVVPEGVVAIKTVKSTLRPDDYTLIIDIGEVSTDIAICQYTSVDGSTATSSPNAGTGLVSLVMDNINDEENVRVSKEAATQAIVTGNVKIGATEKNVVSIVVEAKRKFVNNYLREDIISVLTRRGIPVSQIAYVVPIGGIMSTALTGSVQNMIIDSLGLENSKILTVGEDFRYVNAYSASQLFEKVFENIISQYKEIGETVELL